MRTFIAIELPQDIKDSLAKLQNRLKETGADVKWVEPQNIHLTLKFLGERDEKKVKQISQVIEKVALGRSTFAARIASLGAFPGIKSPRVIWVGINQGDSETKEIAKELEEEIAKIGIPKEDRPFSSHITIGRTRSSLNRERLAQELQGLANDLAGKNLEFCITKITIFKSTLTPKGPIYERLKDASLKTS